MKDDVELTFDLSEMEIALLDEVPRILLQQYDTTGFFDDQVYRRLVPQSEGERLERQPDLPVPHVINEKARGDEWIENIDKGRLTSPLRFTHREFMKRLMLGYTLGHMRDKKNKRMLVTSLLTYSRLDGLSQSEISRLCLATRESTSSENNLDRICQTKYEELEAEILKIRREIGEKPINEIIDERRAREINDRVVRVFGNYVSEYDKTVDDAVQMVVDGNLIEAIGILNKQIDEVFGEKEKYKAHLALGDAYAGLGARYKAREQYEEARNNLGHRKFIAKYHKIPNRIEALNLPFIEEVNPHLDSTRSYISGSEGVEELDLSLSSGSAFVDVPYDRRRTFFANFSEFCAIASPSEQALLKFYEDHLEEGQVRAIRGSSERDPGLLSACGSVSIYFIQPNFSEREKDGIMRKSMMPRLNLRRVVRHINRRLYGELGDRGEKQLYGALAIKRSNE